MSQINPNLSSQFQPYAGFHELNNPSLCSQSYPSHSGIHEQTKCCESSPAPMSIAEKSIEDLQAVLKRAIFARDLLEKNFSIFATFPTPENSTKAGSDNPEYHLPEYFERVRQITCELGCVLDAIYKFANRSPT